MNLDARSIAAALGGEVHGNKVLAPGPGHSKDDRSLSILLDAKAPGGFVVNSFARDDPISCKDYVRQKIGAPEWEPERSGDRPRFNGQIAKTLNGGRNRRQQPSQAQEKPRTRVVAEYVYRGADGGPSRMVTRTEPKGFPQYRWTGSGWQSGVQGVPLFPYCLPEMLDAEHDAVFICEGEKDVDRMRKHGFVATTNPMGAGKWNAELNRWFTGKDCYILADNDDAGRNHAHDVARHLQPVASTVRVIDLPDLPVKGDVSDWLNADEANASRLMDVANAAPIWTAEAALSKSPPLLTVLASDFAGKPTPPRSWHVDDLIPARTVTLLGGDGGTGKSLLALQLGVATAMRRKWINRTVVGGRVAYFSAEDDLDEIHRRLVQITGGQGIRLGELKDLRIIPRAGEDAVLAAPAGKSNILGATPLMGQITDLLESWHPTLLILDNLADIFAGEENSRPQARQFIGMLLGLALNHSVTVVVLSHPSLTGLSSGSGTSGSTGWNNSVRSRLYLFRAVADDGIEPDPDMRVLTTKKSNYSRIGEEIRIRWEAGVFLPMTKEQAGGIAAATAELRAEQVFFELVRAYQVEGRHVSAQPSANYAPSVFAKDARAKGISRVRLIAAMNKHFEARTIKVEMVGPPSKQRGRIVPAKEGQGL